MLDVTLPGIDLFDLHRINIQTQHRRARFRELQAKRQPHIPKTDYCDIHHNLRLIDFFFQIRGQSSAFPRHSMVAGIS